MKFTDSEIGTILAALRYWQDHFDNERADMPLLHDIADNGGSCVPLTSKEINELCERINCVQE